MVVWMLRSAKKLSHKEEMCKELVENLPYIKSVIINVNTREDNVILGKEEHVLYGNSLLQMLSTI